jgi:hypothetical protein
MRKFNALLNLRLKPKENQSQKMTALAERSTSGELSGFSGIFRVNKLNEHEVQSLENLLKDFRENNDYDVKDDLKVLTTITSEVKAITNQAVILHGERIKKAQDILKKYRDGAFTAWLVATYGNRQTPYNFLQYFEFYQSMPQELQTKMDDMPRQAIYTLASRTGPLESKQEIVRNYQGQPKQELLTIIRSIFPLAEGDRRAPNIAAQSLQALMRCKILMKRNPFEPTPKQKTEILTLLKELERFVEKF